MKHRINLTFSTLLVIVLSLSVIACSNNSGSGTGPKASAKKVVSHTHIANKCIDTVNHAHKNGGKKHLHHYHFCEESGVNSNAHSHPSNSITGFTRHVHPNGANKHTHGQ